MTRAKFDLLHEPWIAVLWGREKINVSLTDILVNAPQISALATAHPLHFFAIHRLLLAITHRAIGPGGISDRADVFEKWPAEKLVSYLEKFNDRFDLLSAERPFMQHPGLAAAGLREKPWTQLAPECASGNTKLLFSQNLDHSPGEISPAEAASHLVGFLQFTAGGLVKAYRTSATRGPASNLSCIFVEGTNLAETLALNLVPQSRDYYQLDIPAWEAEPIELSTLSAATATVPAGPAQRYSWISRVVQLKAAVGKLSHAYIAEGVDLDDGPVPDPMAALIRGKDEQLFTLKINPERAFWRDLHALAADVGSHPPATLNSALAILAELSLPSRGLSLIAGGLCADKAKLVLWRLERHRITSSVLQQGAGAAQVLRPAAKRADDIARSLRVSLEMLCRHWLECTSGRSADKGAVTSAADALQALPHFWQGLETEYWAFVDKLGNGVEPGACLVDWETEVIMAAKRSWREAANKIGSSGRNLFASAQAEGWLMRQLKPEFQPALEA
jgi:CRISPR system Cascade subunit CasA